MAASALGNHLHRHTEVVRMGDKYIACEVVNSVILVLSRQLESNLESARATAIVHANQQKISHNRDLKHRDHPIITFTRRTLMGTTKYYPLKISAKGFTILIGSEQESFGRDSLCGIFKLLPQIECKESECAPTEVGTPSESPPLHKQARDC